MWHYRRDERVSRSISSIGRRTPEGLQYLAPEICLLYKAPRADVERNAADLDTTAPLLDPTARAWLLDALLQLQPDHPWIERLRR